MAVLIIPDMDDVVMEGLHRRAAATGRSTEAEVLQILRQAVGPIDRGAIIDRGAVIDELRRIRAMSGPIKGPTAEENHPGRPRVALKRFVVDASVAAKWAAAEEVGRRRTRIGGGRGAARMQSGGS